MILTMVRQDLDPLECANPSCKGGHPIYIHPNCHKGAGFDVGYDSERGLIILNCHACKKVVGKIEVAEATLQ